MTPAKYNMTLNQGITFGPLRIKCQNAQLSAVNLTGWSVAAHAKRTTAAQVIDLHPTITAPLSGEITIELPGAQTKNFPAGDYNWDLILIDPIKRPWGPYIQGQLRVLPVVTTLNTT